MFTLTMKVLRFLWPFIREMVLGEKTLKQAVKTNKGRVFIIGVIFASFVTNFYIIPKVWSISSDYLELKKNYEILLGRVGPAGIPLAGPVANVPPIPDAKPPEPPDTKTTTPATPAPSAPSTPTPAAQTTAQLHDRYDRWKESFKRLREYENGTVVPGYE